jgi:hypothetical protein
MSLMNWFNNKPKTDETLRKLVDLAGGDLALVSRAIRGVRHDDDKPADLAEVVTYIVRHRRPPVAPAPHAPTVPEQRTAAHA